MADLDRLMHRMHIDPAESLVQSTRALTVTASSDYLVRKISSVPEGEMLLANARRLFPPRTIWKKITQLNHIVANRESMLIPLVHLFAGYLLTREEVLIEASIYVLLALGSIEGVVVGLLFIPSKEFSDFCLHYFRRFLPAGMHQEMLKLRAVYHQWFGFSIRRPNFWTRLEVVKYVAENATGSSIELGVGMTADPEGPWPDHESMTIDAPAYHMVFADLYWIELGHVWSTKREISSAVKDVLRKGGIYPKYGHPVLEFLGDTKFVEKWQEMVERYLSMTYASSKYRKLQERIVVNSIFMISEQLANLPL